MSNTTLFFFQAEDGIRYHCVTGVQTCALPISTQTIEFRQHEATMEEERIVMWVALVTRLVAAAHEMPPSVYVDLVSDKRSEERRVGKEGRIGCVRDD